MTTWLSLAAALLSALNNVSAKYILEQRLPRKYVASLGFFLMTIIMGVFSPWYFHFQLDSRAILLMLLVGLLDTLGNFLYFAALQGGEVGNVSVYFSLSPLWTMLVGIFAGSLSSWLILPAVLIMTLAVAFLNLKPGHSFREVWSGIWKRNSQIAMGSAFMFGISAFVLKELFQTGSSNPPTVFLFRCLIVLMSMFIYWRPKLWLVGRRDWWLVGGRGIMVIGKWLCLLYAINRGDVLAAVAVTNSTPLFILVFSTLALHEKITLPKLVASILVVGGISIMQIAT